MKDKTSLNRISERKNLYQSAMERLEKLETERGDNDIFNRFKAEVIEGRKANMKLANLMEEGN